ncbi:MAG: DUF1631 family protein [Halioglobus sp.]
MAHLPSCCALDLFHRPGGLEDIHLKLSAQNIPLSCSALAFIEQRGSSTPSAQSTQEALTVDEIIGYYDSSTDQKNTILQIVLASAEAMGDPSLPSRQHTALIHWLDDALALFQSKFALESEIQEKTSALKRPLLQAVLLDSTFATPGAHPLHQLIDLIHTSGIGWQRQIGRAAAAYEELVSDIVGSVNNQSEGDSPDLPELVAKLASTHERDQQRALKMMQRVVDAELGRLKTLAARTQAGRMINDATANLQAPSQISQLITGAWYDSAQLTLLKFGGESPEWGEVHQTTDTLLRSVQPFTEGGAGSRQELFELVTQIPRSLRRWLISLQHDSEALESTIEQVESVHMQLLRQQELELVPIEPIALPDYDERPARGAHFDTISTLRAGRWLALKLEGEWLRCQLCLNQVASQRLIFCNRSGMKAASLNYEEFAELINAKSIRLLQVGKAFSLCLARAAGIDDTDQLTQIPQAV